MRVVFTRIATQELEDAIRSYDLEYTSVLLTFKLRTEKSANRSVGRPVVSHRAVKRCN
jgi:hypothetical protein